MAHADYPKLNQKGIKIHKNNLFLGDIFPQNTTSRQISDENYWEKIYKRFLVSNQLLDSIWRYRDIGLSLDVVFSLFGPNLTKKRISSRWLTLKWKLKIWKTCFSWSLDVPLCKYHNFRLANIWLLWTFDPYVLILTVFHFFFQIQAIFVRLVAKKWHF